MADDRDDTNIFWVLPEQRGVFTFDRFHLPRSVAKQLRTSPWSVTLNRDFAAVIHQCATTRKQTWINHDIETLYCDLNRQGITHSVEIWDEDKRLIGGLYGLSHGAVFFAESMFSTQSGASKLALTALIMHLQKQGFAFCDAQFVNDHLQQFGVQEWDSDTYRPAIYSACSRTDVSFIPAGSAASFALSSSDIGSFIASLSRQSITQTS